MHRICVAIWGVWTFSTFISLHKKGDLKQCANYRTIALVSHASKILLRIILEKIGPTSEDRNGNCRCTGKIPTRKEDKRSDHESQNTDAQNTRATTTTLHVFVDFKKA